MDFPLPAGQEAKWSSIYKQSIIICSNIVQSAPKILDTSFMFFKVSSQITMSYNELLHSVRLLAKPPLTISLFQFPVLALYILYLAGFFYFPLKFLFSWKLNCACSFIITCETVSRYRLCRDYRRSTSAVERKPLWHRFVIFVKKRKGCVGL